MSRSKEHNEQEALKLDEYFKETLARVRPYILELTSTENAQLCKVWLDKLSVSSSQRRLRNEYLVELCRQLKTGHIGGIFSRPPPNGLLLPLPKSYHMVCISSSLSDLSDYAVRPHRSCLKPNVKCIQRDRQRSKTPLRQRTVDTTNTSQCSHAVNITPTVHFLNENVAAKNRMKVYEHRINTLSTIIAELQTKNEYLKNQLMEYQEDGTNRADKHLYSSINQLTSEVTALKTKLVEVQSMKDALEASHEEIVQQYHGAVVEQLAKLKHQLKEAQSRNEVLDNNVAIMAEKLEEIIHGKDEQVKAREEQWMDKLKIICQRYDTLTGEKSKQLQIKQELLQMKDLELSQRDVERKQEIELLTNKIQDLETKLETKIKDEGKLQVMIVEQYATMKHEFSKMRGEIDLATQKQNQNLTSKIAALKKAVMKLEKSKERLGHDYEKRISHIIKNKDLEIKALQLRLQGQKNELCTSLSSEKQCEVDNIVAVLEERYRTLLAEAEATAESQNQEYLRKIAVLEDQVLRLKRF